MFTDLTDRDDMNNYGVPNAHLIFLSFDIIAKFKGVSK